MQLSKKEIKENEKNTIKILGGDYLIKMDSKSQYIGSISSKRFVMEKQQNVKKTTTWHVVKTIKKIKKKKK